MTEHKVGITHRIAHMIHHGHERFERIEKSRTGRALFIALAALVLYSEVSEADPRLSLEHLFPAYIGVEHWFPGSMETVKHTWETGWASLKIFDAFKNVLRDVIENLATVSAALLIRRRRL